jgi:hypothetical protein
VKYYGWEEWVPTTTASFQKLNGGRSGDSMLNPAYTPNGVVLALNSFAMLQRAYYDPTNDWIYIVTGVASTSGGAGTLTVSTTDPGTGDGNFTVTTVTTLQVDQKSGVTLTGSGSVTATIILEAASSTHAGTVNLVAQTLGAGDKTFTDNVHVYGGLTTTHIDLLTFSNPGGYPAGEYGVFSVKDDNTGQIASAFQNANTGDFYIGRNPDNNASYAVVDGIGTIRTGIYITLTYIKGDGVTVGTLTFAGGLLVNAV